MKKLLSFLTLLLTPSFLWAQPSPTDVLKPPAIWNGTDLSIFYLQDIFGVVDGVLHGSGTQIMGKMFGVFNAGAIVLGAIIITYTLIVSTLNTAHEGEPLGQKWSSIWIPVRSVLGIGLLLPRASGYSTIQIFVMWVVVQGVAVADSVWDAALNYLQNGGVLIQQPQIVQEKVAGVAGNILRSQICMYSIQAALDQWAKEQRNLTPPNNVTVPLLSNTVTPMPTNCMTDSGYPTNMPTMAGGKCVVWFPGPRLADYDVAGGPQYSQLIGICGSVSWDKNYDPATESQPLLTMAKQVGVQQMILDLGTAAREIVNAKLPIGSNTVSTLTVDQILRVNIFNEAASDYQGIVKPVSDQVATNYSLMTINGSSYYDQARKEGWINAGRYYLDLTNINRRYEGTVAAPEGTDKNSILQSLQGDGHSTKVYVKNELQTYSKKLVMAMPGGDVYANTVINFVNDSTINDFIDNNSKGSDTYGGHQTELDQVTPNLASNLVLEIIMGPIVNSVAQIFTAWGSLATAQQNNVNPVVMVALMGNGLMELALGIFMIGTIGVAGVTALVAWIPCEGLYSIIGNAVNFASGFIWPLVITIFVTGATMAFYIPMIPFIIFLWGAIGWLIAVVEAMVAGPLVALGITHPEGDPVLGKADPAVLLLVNVFLRPSLMIIGFIAGIIISYVGVWILNYGFFGYGGTTGVWGTVLQFTAPGYLTFIFAVIPMMMIIYTGIVFYILYEAFGLINMLADQVMRWIGQQAEGIGHRATQAMQGIKGEAEGGARATGGAMQVGAGTAKGMETKASGQSGDDAPSKATQGGGGSGGGAGGGSSARGGRAGGGGSGTSVSSAAPNLQDDSTGTGRGSSDSSGGTAAPPGNMQGGGGGAGGGGGGATG